MKIINVILGIATMLILAALINLGIKAFYPEPTPPEYFSTGKPYMPAPECVTNDADCIAKRNAYNEEQRIEEEKRMREQQAYQDALKVYNKDFFILANVIGIIVFIIAFWLLMNASAANQSVLIGMMAAGLWSIFYGYLRGWMSVDDKIKFIVGLVVAAMVIGGSVWLLQRHQKKQAA